MQFDPVETEVSLREIAPDLTMSDCQHLIIPFEDLIFEKQIGRGSFGTVYKGLLHGEPVAIKLIHSEEPTACAESQESLRSFDTAAVCDEPPPPSPRSIGSMGSPRFEGPVNSDGSDAESEEEDSSAMAAMPPRAKKSIVPSLSAAFALKLVDAEDAGLLPPPPTVRGDCVVDMPSPSTSASLSHVLLFSDFRKEVVMMDTIHHSCAVNVLAICLNPMVIIMDYVPHGELGMLDYTNHDTTVLC